MAQFLLDVSYKGDCGPVMSSYYTVVVLYCFLWSGGSSLFCNAVESAMSVKDPELNCSYN